MKEIKVLSRSSFLAQIQTHLAIKKIKTIFKGPISIQYTESIGDTILLQSHGKNMVLEFLLTLSANNFI
ncbi:MAG: hypothetical protein CM15mP70_17140 [Pelagibacteraceae bacterium]|nr:MAG: hypothetical protein CM15mP70_17140 [Pelagibacteraceae bacterium]